MNHRDHDEDLIKAFEELRSAEAEAAPLFVVPSSRDKGSWRLGFGAYAAAIAPVIICTVLIVLSRPDDANRLGADSMDFSDLAEIVSRELYASSVSTWESPTSFLIHTELPTLTDFAQ